MSEETAPEPSTDDNVTARWEVTVLPEENISIHYQVTPKDEKDAVSSVSGSVVEKKDGMVMHSFFGSTASDVLAARPGQGMTGDVGADVSVFHGHEMQGELFAVLAGTIRQGEQTSTFYFTRPVDLTVVDQGSQEEE